MEQLVKDDAKKLGKIFSQCWSDEGFKQRFMDDPGKVMKEAGIEVPKDKDFKVVENTDQIHHIILPAIPNELSDEQLDSVAGGEGGACLIDGMCYTCA